MSLNKNELAEDESKFPYDCGKNGSEGIFVNNEKIILLDDKIDYKIDYGLKIKETKTKILELLSGINLDTITGEELSQLGINIKGFGSLIEYFEISQTCIDKINLYNNNNLKNTFISFNMKDISLDKVKENLKRKRNIIFMIIKLVNNGIGNMTGKKIIEDGKFIELFGNEINELEIIEKSLKIKEGF